MILKYFLFFYRFFLFLLRNSDFCYIIYEIYILINIDCQENKYETRYRRTAQCRKKYAF